MKEAQIIQVGGVTYYPVSKVAEMLHLSTYSINDKRKALHISYYRVGCRVYFSGEQVQQLIEGMRREG